MKKKILFLINALNGGGAERVLLKILSNLDEDKFEVILALGEFSGEYIDQVPEKVHVINLSNSYSSFPKNIFKLHKIIKNNKVDLTVGFLNYSNLLLLQSKFFLNRKLKVVITEHSNPNKNYVPSRFWIRSLFKKNKLKFFYRFANKIVTVSEGIKEQLIVDFGLSSNQITAIHNPADIVEITRKSKENIEFFDSVSDEEKVIIAVGRMVEPKGYIDMIEVFNDLSKKINVRLIILGDGDLRQAIENKIKEFGIEDIVHLPGFVHNPWAYIYNSDVYLSTSHWEGFHMTIVESMVCGLYPIVSDCNYGPREIIINKKMGTLVPVGDKKLFVKELYEFLSTHKKGSRYNDCFIRAKDFDTLITSKKYSTLFLDLIS